MCVCVCVCVCFCAENKSHFPFWIAKGGEAKLHSVFFFVNCFLLLFVFSLFTRFHRFFFFPPFFFSLASKHSIQSTLFTTNKRPPFFFRLYGTMSLTALQTRRTSAGRSSTLLRFGIDVVEWWCVFVLIGAPVCPGPRAIVTLLSAVIVSCTWPLSLLAWCEVIATSLQRERGLIPRLETVVDLFTIVPPKDRLAGNTQVKRLEKDSEKEEDVSSAVVGPGAAACGYDQHAASAVAVVNDASQASRCFVLAAALLCGGLFGQLDWQVPYQGWPYPSLVAYIAARMAYVLVDLKAAVYSLD